MPICSHCGSEFVIPKHPRQRYCSRSCGHSSHGRAASPEYRSWQAMKSRCYRETDPRFRRYGARGIRVCRRWLDSFESFLADLGPKPSPAHSIERVDNDGDYEPGNCRWATPQEQGRNTARNRLVEYEGTRLTIAEWAERIGMNRETLRARFKYGWSAERALTTPPLWER